MTSADDGRREPRRVRCVRCGGSTLVPVIAIAAAVLLVGVAIFVLGHSEGDIVENSVDDSRAFYVAEGGLERMRGWLGDFHADDPDGDPLGKKFENQLLGGGTYTVEITENLSGGSWLGAYRVVSTGVIDGVARQVQAVMIAETFARYQVFVENAGWVWFRTGERFEGPVHVNHDLQIDGDPWFGGPVTVGGGLTQKTGSNPTFEMGYELGVENIPLPDDSYPTDRIRPAAESGGFAFPALVGQDAKYHIDLGHFGPGLMGYKSYGKVGGVYTWSDWMQVDLAPLNGAIWSPEPIRLEGTLDGQLTIGVEGNIEIWGDILYDGVAPGNTPPPDCDDVLGLIADGDVIIAYTVPNWNDCMFYGVAMALEKSVEAAEYQHYAPRGVFEMYGGLIADYSIHMAQYDNDGNLISGYVRDYNWDSRMIAMPPPFFPLTGRYFVYSWEEVVPPEV
jgi:hypothetical protein